MSALEFAYDYCTADLGQDDEVPKGLTQVKGYLDEQGYGHCDFAVLAKGPLGYYAIEGGGCSCGGHRDVFGPYTTLLEAEKHIGRDRYDMTEDG